MPLDVALLVLRTAVSLALYAFLMVLFIYIWRDVRAASQQPREIQRPSGRLVVVQSDGINMDMGREYPLHPLTTLGRSPTNSIVLPDTFASTSHARIVLRRGQWWLEDQQSRNGTTVNDVPISDPVVLSTGDEIGIGRVKLRLEIE
jgi:hypothetical protein